MDFDDGAEYDVLKHRRVHRAASVAFALMIAGANVAQGATGSVKLLVLPVIAIWFADELADHEKNVGGLFTPRQTALGFRWVGWLALVVFAALAGYRFWP